MPEAPKGNQNRRTPRWLFDALNERFGPFQLDAFASQGNALCDRYHTAETGGLTAAWCDGTFANPPFGIMAAAVEQAVEQAALGRRSCIIGPAVGSQGWFHNHAILGTVWHPDCRINFDDEHGIPTGPRCKENGADRDTVILTFGGEHQNHPANVRRGIFRVRRIELANLRP